MTSAFRILLALSLLTALLGPVRAEDAPTWHDDPKEAFAEAKRLGRPVLIDFTGSDWCVWCEKLDAEVFDTPRFAAWARGELVLLRVDFPQHASQTADVKRRNEALKTKYGVRGYPTIVLVDADGTVLAETGYVAGGPGTWIEDLEGKRSGETAEAGEPEEALPELPTTFRARLPVRIVGHRLVTRVSLSGPADKIQANLLVAPERPCGLELHNRAAQALGIETPSGRTFPITLHVPGGNAPIARREQGDEEDLERYTKHYSRELEEQPCVGTLGARFFARFRCTYDLDAGLIELGHLEGEGEPPDERDESIDLSRHAGLVWLPVDLGEHGRAVMCLGGSRYDTVVDEDVCFEREQPGGRLAPVRLGSFDLATYVAFRPESLPLAHPDLAFGVLGLNALLHFRIDLDPVAGKAWIRPTAAPKREEADALYFEARAEEEPGALETWLAAHDESRLAREAADGLLQLQLDSFAETAALEKAVRWVHDTRREDLRATEAAETMKMLLEAEQPDLAVLAAELGIESGRKDRYPDAVHRLHAALGEMLLERGQSRKAWEHLMSAAFGLAGSDGSPELARVNLLLGRYYESKGRVKRALSRYLQAVLTPETGEAAVHALEALQAKVDGTPLSYEVVERLIAGKGVAQALVAADEFEPDADTDSGRVVLVEHFMNPHYGLKEGERWRPFTVGGSMAAQGVLTHFPRSRVAFVTYPIAVPRPVSLMTEQSLGQASLVGARGPAAVIDGVRGVEGAAKPHEGDALYRKWKALVLQALAHPSNYAIDLEAVTDGDRVFGRATVRGEPRPNTVLQVTLVERGVLYPGLGGTVVHRMVARAPLLRLWRGLPFMPTEGEAVFRFDRSLETLEAKHVAFLDEREADGAPSASRLSTRIDPRFLDVVAVLRDATSGEVLQAAHTTVERAEADE